MIKALPSRTVLARSAILVLFPWFGMLLPGAADAGASETGEDAGSAEVTAGEAALGVNEPMYFIVGRRGGDTTAKFQLSMLFRIFDERGIVAENIPFSRNLHFAYTQTSLWNLSEDSAPFDDTSYRPSLFLQFGELADTALRPSGWRIGLEHESNGQADLRSRSIDTLFVQPAWYRETGHRDFVVIPRLIYYMDKSENPDIRDYRGYGDLVIRAHREDSWTVQSVMRLGARGRGSIQLDISYPVRAPVFARTGGFIYLQLFHGYGETLIDYAEKTSQVRVGFALVR